MSTFSVRELADHVSGVVEGDGSRRISGVATVEDAGPGDVTFVVDGRYERRLREKGAGAAIIPEAMPAASVDTALIRVPDPHRAFGRILTLFHPVPRPPPGIAPTARIGRGVRLGDEVSVGAYAVLGERVELGARSSVGPHAVLEADVHVGEDCAIAPGCTLLHGVRLGDRVRLQAGVRLGTDGFGYTSGGGGQMKVPQIGGCVIGDDVEIGANSTIDRGSVGDTVIGEGTKIDNLVHIGHNVRIGRHCTIVAQVGVAGSVRIGERAQLAGQAGIAGHLTIGDGARIGAQAGVIGDVPAGASYSGYPARPHRESLRASAALLRLPALFRRMSRVEERLGGEAEL